MLISKSWFQSNFWFSDVFRNYKTGTLGRNRSSFLTHFSPVLFFYTPYKRQKVLYLPLFPCGIRLEHWEEMGEIISYLCKISTKFKESFFQRATFSNYFWIFKSIARESIIHSVPSVYEQVGIGVQINTPQ